MKLREGLYAYPWESMTENNCNAYLIDGPVRTLIDPGHAHLLHHLEAKMAQDGFTFEDVHLAVATHPHPDHCEGLLALQKLGVKTTMHVDADAFIRSFSDQWRQMTGQEMPAFHMDFHLKEGTLELGTEKLKVLETPGHAPGSICLLWERQGVLFPGDVVFAQSIGRVDLPGGDAAQLMKSLERLMGLDVDLLCPGHGPWIEGRGAVKENFYIIRQAIFGMGR